ncbi:MAG: putative small lipoprotein YifL [Bermanella sp.]|jgi:predicted small lipoprotein YifL
MRYSIILCAILLVGCGQKGALYMPSEKSDALAQAMVKSVSSTHTYISNTAE